MGRLSRRSPPRDPPAPEIHLYAELDFGAGPVRLPPRQRGAPRGERRHALLPGVEGRRSVRLRVRRTPPGAPVRRPPRTDGSGDVHQRAFRLADGVLLPREPPRLPAGPGAGEPPSPVPGVAAPLSSRGRLQGGGAHPSVRDGSLRSVPAGEGRVEEDAPRPGGPLGAPGGSRRFPPRPPRIRATARGVLRHPGRGGQPAHAGPRDRVPSVASRDAPRHEHRSGPARLTPRDRPFRFRSPSFSRRSWPRGSSG